MDYSFAKTGSTNGLDAPLARRYRCLGGKMKKKTLFLSALLLVVLALEGCATINGIGEDIQNLGRALKRAVSG